MSDEQEEFKNKLQALKPKKKKLAVPEGFLEGAKSYEGKVEAVKIISEREKERERIREKTSTEKAPAQRIAEHYAP